jgi:hypothetical protein
MKTNERFANLFLILENFSDGETKSLQPYYWRYEPRYITMYGFWLFMPAALVAF